MYNISSNNKSFLKPKDYWDTLSLREKAAMISIAVKNGIYNIEDVRNEYNELANDNANIYDGIDESTNQMQVQNKSFVDNTIPIIYNTDADKPVYINSTTGDVWQSGKPIGSFVLPEVTITAPNPKNEKHRVEDFIQNIIPTGKEIAGQNIRDYLTESNDNAWVDIPLTYRKKNPHLEERVIKGADGHNAWVKEHPVADAIGNIAASVPFAVASYPLWGSAISGLSSYAPTMANTLAPGSSFWMNPLTKQMTASTLGGSTMDAMSTLMSGKTIGENVAGLTEQTTGWNPYSSIWTSWMPDMANLGYYTPYGLINRGVTNVSNTIRNKIAAKSLKNEVPPAENIFKSELDWSPEGWLGKRVGGYDAEDIAALESHIPEYLEIERLAKQNGTWLKMPDGSIWTGDPRSWVQLNSKALKTGFNKDVFWSGREHGFNPNYTGAVWGVRGGGEIPPLQARTYTIKDSEVLPLISEEVPITTYDVKGSYWTKLWDKPGLSTDKLVSKTFKEGAKRIHIDNVIDPGSNVVPSTSIFLKDSPVSYRELIYIPQNDVIIAPNIIRKSLIGNNGNFSKVVKDNAFKGIVPTLIGTYSIEKLNN